MTVTATTKTELWAPIGMSALLLTGDAKWYPSPVDTPAPPLPHQCPHGCKRDRHPEPLTRNVAYMYDNHHFREDYDPAEDDTEIVCVGANYHGPNRPPSIPESRSWGFSNAGWYPVGYITEGPTTKSPNWLTQMTEATYKFIASSTAWIIPELPEFKWGDWIDPEPEPLEPCEIPEGVTVTFDNDWQPWEHANPHDIKANIKLSEHIHAHRNDFPTPPQPGYDFSKYAEEQTTPYWIGALK